MSSTDVMKTGMATILAVLFVALSSAPPAIAAPWEGRTYPSTYDLRNSGRVTGVRDQSGYATCWVMAAMGSLESCLLPQMRRNYSENHLANFQSSALSYQGRASNRISMAYFARWEGPVMESDDPYPRPGKSPEGLRAVRHVQNMLTLPRTGPKDNAAIKWAVMTHGAVAAGVAYHREFMQGDKKAYYHPDTGDTEATHYISIAGWNDRYPAGNFSRRAPGNGAFLVKNSWGAHWGLDGYFWISYYDPGFAADAVVMSGTQGVSNYQAVYQYDPLAWTKTIGLGGETAWFANRFTCAGTGSVKAASFYVPVPDATYEVRVAASLGEIANAPVAGQGSLSVGGYRTVRLTNPVPVEAGKRFVVAVRLTTPGSTSQIALEHPSKLSSPTARPGQSFISNDASAWTDLTTRSGMSRSNVCLKAFVVSAGAADTRPPRARLQGDTVTRGGTANIAYTLTDPAFSSGSAVIRLTLKNQAGRVLRSRHVPALCVDEKRAWRFSTLLLPRGTYRVEARAFDVAGNRQPGSSAVSLRVL